MLTNIHNGVLKAVLGDFYSRFSPEWRVLWISEEDEPALAARADLHRLGVSLLHPRSLPSVVIEDEEHRRLALIDVADLRGLMTEKRRKALKKLFGGCNAELTFVNAFRNRRDFQASLTELPWETVIWFLDEPNHWVYFNGKCLFGPTLGHDGATPVISFH
jgi:type II restriction enzyme